MPFFALEKAVDERAARALVGAGRTRLGGRRRRRATRPDERRARAAGRLPRRLTGRRLDEARLERILELANEQQEWSRRTRDLAGGDVPAPLDIVDSIPAVMIPQWHRGTEWARDAARAFHEEVAERGRRRRGGLRRRAAAADVDRPRALVQPRLLPALPARVRRGFRVVDVPRDRRRRLPALRRAAAARARRALRGVHRLPRHAGMGRPVVPEGGAGPTTSTASCIS